MPTPDILFGFISSAVILALVPGSDNIYVLTQSVLSGKRTGILITLGLCTGLVGHTIAVAIGIATLFQTSELAYTLLKIVEAGYLLFLAYQSIKAANASLTFTKQPALSDWQLYKRGVLMNLTNPKVAIFFLAFLPQFTQSEKGHLAWQIVTLGGLFMLCALCVFSGIAVSAAYLAQRIQTNPTIQHGINWLAALVFFILAFSLVLSTR